MKTLLIPCFFVFAFCCRGQIADSMQHQQQVDRLIALSRQYTEAGNYEKATQASESAMQLAEATFGQESAAYAACLFNRGRIFQFSGQFEQALPPYLQALDIRERVLGKEHYDYAASLNNLGYVYWQLGRYPEAERMHKAALAIRKRILGEDHPEYAMSLNNLAIIYVETGRYDAADTLYKEALAIRAERLGSRHPDYAQSLNNLANLYSEMGRYEAAEPLFQEACVIWRQRFGEANPNYASTLLNLANLYFRMGRYEDAEVAYLKSLDLLEQLVGQENLIYIRNLNNLANLYIKMGRYKTSERYFLQATDILEGMPGRANADEVRNLDGLAQLYNATKRFAKAEALNRKAQTLTLREFGRKSRHYAYLLNNLANLYTDTGRFAAADSLYREALEIWEELLGKAHPDYAMTLYGSGNLHQQMGLFGQAEADIVEAKAIQEAALGKGHPDYLVILDNLAALYQHTGRMELARQLYDESQATVTSLLARSARYLSNREMAAYSRLLERNLNRFFSFAQLTRVNYSGLSATCYDLALFNKGLLLNITSRINRLAATDTAAARLIEQLRTYHRRLAREYAKPLAERQGVDTLRERANATERELVRTVAGFEDALRQVHWQEVQAALSPGEAAVEFVRYRYYNPNPTDSILYAALLLRPGDVTPRMIPLFEEHQLAQLLPPDNDIDLIDALYRDTLGQKVYALVWQPLDSLLVGISTLYCSPAGLLYRLNLGALPSGPGRIFTDRRQLVLLGSTRQLAQPTGKSESDVARAVLWGGIRYETTAFPEKTRGRGNNPDSLRTGDPKSWKYLPATIHEVRTIAAILHKHGLITTLLIDTLANEAAFKQLGRTMPAPGILHLATHGYFFPDPAGSQEGQGVQFSDDPMIRSGLILAGANAAWTSGKPPEQGEDGILTAYEISQQDLSGTQLVVLSACESALGELEGNEGVFGLQRAFKIAGARYLVMSLWQVNDQKTGELMTGFYHQYLDRNLPARQAFRAAQQAMRGRYPESPYAWAGFIFVE